MNVDKAARRVEFTLVACDSAPVEDAEWRTRAADFRVKYEYYPNPYGLRSCGSIDWDFTRAGVEGSRIIGCDAARRIAAGYRDYQLARGYCGGGGNFCQGVNIRGYTCRTYFPNIATITASCKKGRRVVKATYGD